MNPFKEYTTPLTDAEENENGMPSREIAGKRLSGWIKSDFCRSIEKKLHRTQEILEAEQKYVKDMDTVIDDLGVAVSCIGPREDLHRAITALKSRALTAERKLFIIRETVKGDLRDLATQIRTILNT